MTTIRSLSFLSAVTLFGLALTWPARSDQNATCHMDDKDHTAKYSCPDDYEVVFTGEGTKTCDGACYRKGNSKSLEEALRRLITTKWGPESLPASDELSRVSPILLEKRKVSIVIPQKGTFEFTIPRHQQ